MVEVVTISMDRTLKDLLDRHCSLNQCGRSETVRRAIMRYISPEERETAPAPENEALKQELEETKEIPEPEASKMDAGEVDKRVREILKVDKT